jgi:hypothetical protein
MLPTLAVRKDKLTLPYNKMTLRTRQRVFEAHSLKMLNIPSPACLCKHRSSISVKGTRLCVRCSAARFTMYVVYIHICAPICALIDLLMDDALRSESNRGLLDAAGEGKGSSSCFRR